MNLEGENKLSDCRKNVFAFGALTFIIFAIYSNTFDASFHFDDYRNFINHPGMQIETLSWPEIKESLFADRGRLYRPVSAFSLALNHYFSGANPFTYHLVNTVIHCLAAIFLFLFLYRTISIAPVERVYREHPYSIALLGAILWAASPLHTQSVTYIVQRMNSLGGMFCIMALFFYAKGRTSAEGVPRAVFLISCILCSFLAFGSKENTFLLPVIIILYELMVIRKANVLARVIAKKWIILLTLLVAAFLTVVYLYYYQGGHPFSFLKGYHKRVFSMEQRLLTEPRIILFYISLLLYPLPGRLSVVHDIQVSTSILEPLSTLFSIIFIVATLVGVFVLSRRWPFTAFCVLFFFINHLIESTFVPLELVFEHRNYVPSMLFFAPISGLLITAAYAPTLKQTVRGFVLLLIASVVFFYGRSTYTYNFVWKTEETLWLNALFKAPELWRPWQGLGHVYAERLENTRALELFTTALSKRNSANKNDKHSTHFSLGVVYQRLGNYDRALFHYREAERIFPQFAGAHINRGAIFADQGLIEEAIVEMKEAATSDAAHQAEAFSNLGFFYMKQCKFQEAIVCLQAALDIHPDNPTALRRLGYAFQEVGRFGKAYRMYTKALELQPAELSPYLYLAEIYGLRKREGRKREMLKRFIHGLGERGFDDFVRDLMNEKKTFSKTLMDNRTAMRLVLEGVSDGLQEDLKKAQFIEQKMQDKMAGSDQG